MHLLIADIVLVVHFGLALFITAGLASVWLGRALGWAWIRNPCFRLAHIGAIGIVALEGLLGITCPLTLLEDALRGSASDTSFIGRWIGPLLYYDLPEWVFASAYVGMAIATAQTWRIVPPQRAQPQA